MSGVIPAVGRTMDYWMLFLIGVVTSFHCLAMCGGLGLSQSLGVEPAGEREGSGRFRAGFLYNLGRVSFLPPIGGVAGAAGGR